MTTEAQLQIFDARVAFETPVRLAMTFLQVMFRTAALLESDI
jgi:hypothetical protein